MSIRTESLMKASCKIIKRLFLWNYSRKKYHRSVNNVAIVCVVAIVLRSSIYAWFVTNNNVTAGLQYAMVDQNNIKESHRRYAEFGVSFADQIIACNGKKPEAI